MQKEALYRRAGILLAATLLTACGGGSGGSVAPEIIAPGTFSLSGEISVSPFILADADTNNPDAPPNAGNNAQSTAQLVPNPGTVGGYANRAGTGNQGPAFADGDPHDFYRVNLLAGQTVRLTVSDYDATEPARIDPDLLLVDLDNVLVDDSSTLLADETITVPYSGEFVVVVTMCADELFAEPQNICGAGATNYLLTMGQAGASETGARKSQGSDFVPGEALVVYKDAETTPIASVSSASSMSDGSDVVPRAAKALRSVERVRFNPRAVSRQTLVARNAKHAAITVSEEQSAKLATLGRIKTLVASGEVEWAEPNFLRQPLFEPNDPGFELQWHYTTIDLPGAWDYTVGDPNVTVAVIDTGILANHPDLQGQLLDGFDFVSDVSNSGDGDGIDPDPADPGDGGGGFSSSFHGTHVTGTVAAAGNNGRGVTGVAYGALAMPLRGLGLSGGSVFDIRRAMCFAAGISGTQNCPFVPGVPNNPNPVDVINLSLGGASFSQAEQNLINEITAAGVLIVAAAGNDSSSTPFYPAAYEHVFAVSASTLDNRRAPYSNFGNYIDLAAPGGNSSTDFNGDGFGDGVLSTGGDDSQTVTEYTYPFFQGTSMAAPHVAGVFALMRSVNADLTPADIRALLEQGELTDSAEPGSFDQSFGYGVINAQKAVAAALAVGGSPPAANPRLSVNPRSLNFGVTLNEVSVEVRDSAGGDLTVLSITSDQPWLIAPAPNGIGDYQVRVDRSDLAMGNYSGTITIVSAVNTVKIPVILQVSTLNTTGDAGRLRVQLLDDETAQIREVAVNVDEGIYRWQIDSLPAGQYRLFAFSDADNDGEVCDPGEACGAYRTTDQPLLIDLQSSMSELDFPVSYGVEAPQ